jgi:8-oxo-dGTP diphosphatase
MTSTPKILRVALGIVFKDDKVLLVERAKREGDLTWGFPGGKIDPGEESSHAVVRECLEETGVECNQLTLLGELLHEERGVHISYWKGVAFRGEATVMEPEKALSVIWATPEEAEKLFTSQIAKCVRDELGLP